MSLISELLRKNLSTESAVDDSKIGGGPDATTAQPAPEIGSAFEEEAHGTKHDTPGAETASPESAQVDPETVTTAAGEEVPAAAAEPQEPTQSETTADADTATGESTGADAGTDPTATAQEPATSDATTEADAAQVTDDSTQATDGETQNESDSTQTDANAADDGLGSSDGSADTEGAADAGTDSVEPDAGAGAEAGSSDSEADSSEPQPDTENPDNLDPVKELPNPEAESDLKPEVQEAESEGEDAEIAPDTETDDELAEKADLVAGYADAKQSLEEIVETITDSLADGGLTPEGMASAQSATNDVLSSIGEDEMGLPSAESLQTLIGRRENTKLVLESITEKAKAIGKKIWRVLVDLIDRLLAKFTGVESMIKDFGSMEKQLNDIIATREVVHPAAHMELSSEYCRGLGIRKGHDRIVAGEWTKIADWLPKASASLEKQLAAVANKLGDMSAEVPEIVDVGTTPPPAALTLGTDVADKAVVVFTPRLMLEVIKSYSNSTRELLPVLTNCRSMETIRKFAEHQITKTEVPSDEEKAKVRSLVAYIPKAAKFHVFVRNNIAVTRLFCNHYVRLAQRLV